MGIAIVLYDDGIGKVELPHDAKGWLVTLAASMVGFGYIIGVFGLFEQIPDGLVASRFLMHG